MIYIYLQGKYTSKSDVWAFAVTLWEILTFAREQPFEDLSDAKVLENVAHFCDDDGEQVCFSYVFFYNISNISTL
jgi:discoidin domain receptor family protein 2